MDNRTAFEFLDYDGFFFGKMMIFAKNRFIGRFWYGLSFFLLSVGEAAETDQDLEQRLQKLETAYHNAANPPAISSEGPYIQGDILFWQARETGLAYAINANQPLVLDILPRRFNIKEPQFEWDFGFRLGLGYDTLRDGWDVLTQWTRFFTHAHDRGLLSSNNFSFPIWSHPDFDIFPLFEITKAKARWELHFNTANLEIGRAFKVSRFLVLRPFIGPSCAWIKQHYHIEYEEAPVISGEERREDNIKLKNTFFGAGARAGCEARFYFTPALSLLAKCSGALYSGRFNVGRKERFDTSFGKQPFDIADTIHAGRAATTLEMGFGWDHLMRYNRYVHIGLCYDIQFFFKQNQMLRPVAEVFDPSQTFIADQGDLSLHGGSLSLTLGF